MTTSERSDYRYDFYVSYDSSPLVASWIGDVLERLRRTFQASGIFFQEERRENGALDPQIVDAASTSRCMIAVWSPEYFYSRLSWWEWMVFRAREDALSMRNGTLIAPIQFHDGVHFPPEAKVADKFDVRDYTNLSPAFWGSEGAIEFKRELETFTDKLRGLVQGAPPFDPDWPTVDFDEVKPPERPRVALQRL